MADAVEQDQRKNPELIRLLQSGRKSESEIEPSSSETENANSSCLDWSADETVCLLKLIAEYEYLPQLKSDNGQVYTKLSKLMTISGHEKTNEDIKCYWRLLNQKHEDRKAGKLKDFEFYNQINDLFDFNNSCSSSDPEIIIIKGEELDGTVIHSDAENDFSNQDYDEHKSGRGLRGNNWMHKETECVVEVLEKYGMPSRTNLRKFCYVIVDYLKQHGFTRSEEQTQIKIKHLRALYNQVARGTLKEEEFPFFKRIDALMQTCRIRENEESQNYIALDEQSVKSDGEDNSHADFNEQVATEEEEISFKKGRQIWTNKEIKVLLNFIEENRIVTGKQLRKVGNKAVDYLAMHGYYRSSTQILIRWKNTKALYWATFRKKLKFPERECHFFYRLHVLLNPEDRTYETESFEDAAEDDDADENNLYQSKNNTESTSDLTSYRSNEVSPSSSNYLFKKDNFITIQNNLNSNDSFMSVQNVSSNKRFKISDLDPLGNVGGSPKVTPTSLRCSHTEQSEQQQQKPPHIGGCSFCNSLDPIDHYCISLAHSIKKLDARKQAKLKIEIQQMMYKAEFDSNF